MKITELEIININKCKHVHLKWPTPQQQEASNVYLIHSFQKCEDLSLALQLICSAKYAQLSDLNDIGDKIANGKVIIKFNLIKTLNNEGQQQQANGTEPPPPPPDHSSDSDIPCTSRQFLERQQRRLARRRLQDRAESLLEIKACRNFAKNPDIIEYSVNNSRPQQCSALVFQLRFFTCTDIIFPRLNGLTHGEYCQGKWLELMATESLYKGEDENHLIKQFCHLYAQRKVNPEHSLSQLTTSVLTARNSLNQARIKRLIQIFNDIRWVFEYITCSEYTVWFLLPSLFGNLQDITEITLENVNFDLMKTQVQLKTAATTNAPQFAWTQAEGHIQELLLVAVQLAFGHHCQQNIIYLHSLDELKKHQSFEFLNFTLAQSQTLRQNIFDKNYLQRILNICAKLKICCVIEYSGGLPFYPRYVNVIKCQWLDSLNEWNIYLKDSPTSEDPAIIVETFLKDVENTLN